MHEIDHAPAGTHSSENRLAPLQQRIDGDGERLFNGHRMDGSEEQGVVHAQDRVVRFSAELIVKEAADAQPFGIRDQFVWIPELISEDARIRV